MIQQKTLFDKMGHKLTFALIGFVFGVFFGIAIYQAVMLQ